MFGDVEHTSYWWKRLKTPNIYTWNTKIHVKTPWKWTKIYFFSDRQHIKYTFEVCWKTTDRKDKKSHVWWIVRRGSVTPSHSDIEKTNELSDVRWIFNLVNMISNKPKSSPCNLTVDDEGEILNSPEETVERWRKFLENKFKTTPAETLRPDLEKLSKIDDKISRQELDLTVKHLKLDKTTDPVGWHPVGDL